MISVSDLARLTRETEPHFFDRKTMRFFGDRMRNYRVYGPVTIVTPSGEQSRCYELARIRAVKHGLHSSAYFDCETFERRFIRSERAADRMFDIVLRAKYLGVTRRNSWDCHAWELELRIGRRSFRTPYHAGLAHTSDDPPLRSVLSSLQLDASCGALDFAEYIAEFGGEPDRQSRATHRACVQTRRKLETLLGGYFEEFERTDFESLGGERSGESASSEVDA